MKKLKFYQIIVGSLLAIITPSYGMQQPSQPQNNGSISNAIISGIGSGAAILGNSIWTAGTTIGTTIAKNTIGDASVLRWQINNNALDESSKDNSHALDNAIEEIATSHHRKQLVALDPMLQLLEISRKKIQEKTMYISQDAVNNALPYMDQYEAELKKELERVATMIAFLKTASHTITSNEPLPTVTGNISAIPTFIDNYAKPNVPPSPTSTNFSSKSSSTLANVSPVNLPDMINTMPISNKTVSTTHTIVAIGDDDDTEMMDLQRRNSNQGDDLQEPNNNNNGSHTGFLNPTTNSSNNHSNASGKGKNKKKNQSN